jgi:hypothetical protein
VKRSRGSAADDFSVTPWISPSFRVFTPNPLNTYFPYFQSLFAQELKLDSIMSKSFSQSEVASHNKTSDLYIIVDEDVYDLTKFQDEHPGKSFLVSMLTMLIGLTLVKGGKKSTYIPESADPALRSN